MPNLHFAQVALSMRVTVAESDLAAHLATPPSALGAALAREVHAYAEAHQFGYYPALGYFRAQGGVDADLMAYAEEVGWLATRVVRDEVLRKLRPVFASLRFDTLQSTAFAMPTVRPADRNNVALLARHYTPTQVKTDLWVTLLQKGAPTHGLERYAQHLVARWLKPSFERLDLTAASQAHP
ncbi:hypothetical protein HUS23_09455 [Ectothiorhodospiraceae bacterium 2226]|nr:hypothetical protein HUS23_09455 [Ectothiorhodospiraceae bacterium 2226]